MKTYDIIVEQVRSAESLARAFTPRQWTAIIYYYRQKRGLSTITNRQLNKWLNRCGSGMIDSGKAGSHTPSSWNREAATYGGEVESVGSPSWNEIYSHLARAKDEPAPVVPVDQDSAVAFTRYDDTPENFDDISNMIPNAPSEFTQFSELEQYLLQMMNIIKTKRKAEQISFWLDEVIEGSGRPTYPMQQSKAMGLRLRELLEENGAISKQTVDESFFAWLKSFDTSWKKHQEDNG